MKTFTIIRDVAITLAALAITLLCALTMATYIQLGAAMEQAGYTPDHAAEAPAECPAQPPC